MIFVYDYDEKQIATLDVIPKFTEEIGKLRTLEFECDEFFEKGYRIVYSFDDNIYEFIIVDSEYIRSDYHKISYFCKDAMIELQNYVIIDKRPNGSIGDVMSVLLENTRWTYQVRTGNIINDIVKNHFYHKSVLDSFSEIVKNYNIEWITEYRSNGLNITERKIVLYRRDGRSNGRLEFGKNIQKFTRKLLSEPIITRLYPYGRGEEKFDDKRNSTGGYGRRIGIADVNEGVEYIENENATRLYGIGTKYNKTALSGIVIFDQIEDKNELLKLAREELEIVSQPKVEYTVDAIHLDFTAEIGIEVPTIDDVIGYRSYSRVIKIVRIGDDTELTFGTVSKKFVESVQSQITRAEKKSEEAIIQINTVRESADGKTKIFTGSNKPSNASNNDMWYRENANGTVDILIFRNGEWVEHISDKIFKALKQDFEKSKKIIEQTKLNADEEIKKVKESISSLNNGLTQKYNNIKNSLETYVKEEALISGIKQRAGNIFLFSSDGKRINGIRITPDNTYISNGVIKNAHIADASITNAKIADIRAEKIKAGTIDFNKIQGINIDASNITTGSMSANRITAGILRGNKSEYNLNDGVIRTWSFSQDKYSKITNGTISLENYNGKNRMTLIDTGITFHNNNDRVGYLEVVSNDAISLAHQKKKYLAITGNNSYGNQEQYVYFDMNNILGTRDTNYPIKFMKSVYMFEYFRVAKNAHFQSDVYTYNRIFLNDGAKQNRFTIKTLTGFSAGDGKMIFYGNGNVNSGIGVDYNGDVWIIKNGLGIKRLS